MPLTTATTEQTLSGLFLKWAGQAPERSEPLPPSGSHRIYYRLTAGNTSAIGAVNPDKKENRAFIGFSRHFKSKGLPVPEVYQEDNEGAAYLLEDLGDTTLYSRLPAPGQPFSEPLITTYEEVVAALAQLQIDGGQGLDYGLCYPRATFDKQSMLWDFNTFKYYFLRLSGLPFDEQALEKGLHRLADYLLQTDTRHFLFRDFQSRNIMLKDGQPYFIDYQGGRRGALQYDLASLLYQARANMPELVRQRLLQHYLDAAAELISIDREAFTRHFYGYVLMRSIQVLGTYGYRGLYERKEHFLKSIPYALENIRWLLDHQKVELEIPALKAALRSLTEVEQFQPYNRSKGQASPLRVKISSFSYKKGGIPTDDSGNGGGFVFDCRFIHNPGRYKPYKTLTGRDEPVITFLKHRSQMEAFLNDVYRIVGEAVENYVERGFTSLMVNFGCTGGQHRSVYAADALARYLKEKYGISVELTHIEQERKGWINE